MVALQNVNIHKYCHSVQLANPGNGVQPYVVIVLGMQMDSLSATIITISSYSYGGLTKSQAFR